MSYTISIEEKRESLSTFVGAIEGTSLYVLRAIEQTVASLGRKQRLINALAESSLALTSQIRAEPPILGVLFDADDRMISSLENAAHMLETNLPQVITKKAAIDRDNALLPHHCEELHGAYDSYIDSIAGLIEAVKDLKGAVISHDLAAEKAPSESYESVPELLDALKSDC